MKFITTLAASAGLCFLSILPAQAEVYRWDLANEYNSTSIHAEGDRLFRDLVAKESNGKVVVTPHFSASLGFRSKDQLDAVGRWRCATS